MNHRKVTLDDILFISETYQANIHSLHGNNRTIDDWKQLLLDTNYEYYVVYIDAVVAWFRLEVEEDILWLGMLQVHPKYKRQGVGTYILNVIEEIALAKNITKVGIHTTEDNLPARALYETNGYHVTEIGLCTTADEIERIGYTFIKEVNGESL